MTHETMALKPPMAWQRPDIMAASLFVNLLSLVLPVVILQVYDRIIPQSAIGTFSVFVVILLAALTVETALRILRAKILSSAGARFEQSRKSDCFFFLVEQRLLKVFKRNRGHICRPHVFDCDVA